MNNKKIIQAPRFFSPAIRRSDSEEKVFCLFFISTTTTFRPYDKSQPPPPPLNPKINALFHGARRKNPCRRNGVSE